MLARSLAGSLLVASALAGLTTAPLSAQSRFPARNGGASSQSGPIRYPGRSGGMVGQPQYAQPSLPNGGGYLAPTFDRRGMRTRSDFRPRVDFYPSYGGGYGYYDPGYGYGAPFNSTGPLGYYSLPNQYFSGPVVRPATVSIRINPPQAAVYLNGELVGTAGDLARAGRLPLAPGTHLLEAAAPGYVSLAVRFRLKSGQSLALDRSLTPESRARTNSRRPR